MRAGGLLAQEFNFRSAVLSVYTAHELAAFNSYQAIALHHFFVSDSCYHSIVKIVEIVS